MLRLRPYDSNDVKYIINWISNERDFVKWCASCYKALGFVDEDYVEKKFPYKDERWGSYGMALEKRV